MRRPGPAGTQAGSGRVAATTTVAAATNGGPPRRRDRTRGRGSAPDGLVQPSRRASTPSSSVTGVTESCVCRPLTKATRASARSVLISPSTSLIWSEASRTTVFLSVLSTAIITLALLSNAAGGSHTTTLAVVLLPVVLFLGIATHIRVVQINTEEIEVMLAMNRLRHAYLEIAPGLEPYFTTGHHDDAPGVAASFLLPRNPGRLGPWGYFLVNTPTVIATVNAALAAAVVVLAVRKAHAPATIAVVSAAAAFLLVWAALVAWERHTLDPVAWTTPRFPTPPDHP